VQGQVEQAEVGLVKEQGLVPSEFEQVLVEVEQGLEAEQVRSMSELFEPE
jgi:hypothetical protein